MTRVRLHPHSPLEISRLVLGTWRLLNATPRPTVEDVLTWLKSALDHGITTIDTAEVYGRYEVEAMLGEALRRDPGVKARVEIITKCGIYTTGPHAPERRTAHYDATAERVIASAEKSLRLLGVEVLDVLLIHRPDWLTAHEDTARGLETLQQAGKIKAAGVSNYTPAQFEALSSFLPFPLITNQVEFSLFHREPMTNGVFDQAQQRGFSPMAWSPLGGGRLFDPDCPVAARLRAAMQELAPRYGGATPDQLAHAWVLAHPSRPVSILGTNKPARVASTAKADQIQLSREDWFYLCEAARGTRIP